MPKKTKEEIKSWLANKKRQKGDRVVTADENTPSTSVSRMKKEVEVL